MPLIYLVRHGHADSKRERNPELDELGRTQAEEVARLLHARVEAPLPILSSPLARCRQTAAPLERLWGMEAQVEPRVVEVLTPQAEGVVREDWMRFVLASTWSEAAQGGEKLQPGFAAALASWRRSVLATLLERTEDTVIFTHFIPINSVLAHALGLERVLCFQPDNTSVTVVETLGVAGVRLVERGREMVTPVL